MERVIIIVAFILIYFHIGGLGTTNILRLTKGNKLSINSSRCVCDSCGSKIPAYLQIPIVSYILCRGKCRVCGCPIPIFPLVLEILLVTGMSLITFCFEFSIAGVLGSFAFYEVLRWITVLVKGKREEHFVKQSIIAVVSMAPFLVVAVFVSMIHDSL